MTPHSCLTIKTPSPNLFNTPTSHCHHHFKCWTTHLTYSPSVPGLRAGWGCFIQGWSSSSQCTLFQWGDRNSRLSSKVSCQWDINWHTVSGLNQQVTSTFSTRKLTYCPHPSFWLLTLHCSSESIIISCLFLVCLEHAEVSAFKFINLDLKGLFCERPRFIEIAE